MKYIAVIKVRSAIEANRRTKETLKLLNLKRKNCCVVFPENKPLLEMINKVKDYTTYGFLDEEVLRLLLEKRGTFLKKGNKRFLEFKGQKYRPYFYLNPPRKGYGRKGIKMPFKLGGALGFRGEAINDLIRRML